MQLRYVFSETATGLRRNVSMTVAVVVTIFVSLTLVGMGLLLNAQAHKAENYWGSKLQITVFLCNANSRTPHCAGGDVTDPQKQAIECAFYDGLSHSEIATKLARPLGTVKTRIRSGLQKLRDTMTVQGGKQ